jgi:hypothetical protein
MTSAMQLNSLTSLVTWIGLKNSDDQGTFFDLRAELRKNGGVIASGETKNIQGVTRNPNLAKEVAVAFGAISDPQFNSGDVFSIRILTKVADSGGHNNAVGLRLYYDAVSRPSRFGATFTSGGGVLVRITSPAPDTLVERPAIYVFGEASAPAGIQSITVNGIAAQANDGLFVTLIPLASGGNLITATLVDLAGNTASDSIAVTRQDPSSPDFLGMWAALKDALRSGNIETALGFITVKSRERYRGIFTALGPELSQIDLILTNINPIAIRQEDAEFEMFRSGRSFEIFFVRDDDGFWRLASF